MVQQVFPISSGVICKNDVTHQHTQAYSTAEATSIFSAGEVSITSVSAGWTRQDLQMLCGDAEQC